MKKLVILLSVFLVSIAAMSGCSSKEKELPFGAPQKPSNSAVEKGCKNMMIIAWAAILEHTPQSQRRGAKLQDYSFKVGELQPSSYPNQYYWPIQCDCVLVYKDNGSKARFTVVIAYSKDPMGYDKWDITSIPDVNNGKKVSITPLSS